MPNNRFEIKYTHRFTDQTDNGKAFKWLKDNLGSAYDDAITNAVRFMYLPVALAEAGATRQEVEIEIKKAREYFNEKMMVALGSCYEPEANKSIKSNGYSTLSPKSIHPPGVVQVLTENSGSGNATSTGAAAVEEDDDFVELDEDKLMEG